MKLVVAVLAALLSMGSTPAISETLKIAGSTTVSAFLMEPYRAEIEAVSGHEIILFPNRTNLGIKLLFEGRAQLAMISTDLESTLDLLRRQDAELPLERLRSVEVHRTRSAFSVHPGNPVRFATMQHIKDILLGKTTNWRDLGGPDLPIKLVVVREGGGIELSIQAQLLNNQRISAPEVIRVQIASQVNKVVQQEPGAMGLAQIENMKGRHVEEIMTNGRIEQQLHLVWLDEPSAAILSVAEATKSVAKKKFGEVSRNND
jgi:phosphate transport system substrate-binding protein